MSNFELNKGDQFLFAIDVSGSMAQRDCPNGMTRMAPTISRLARNCED